MNAACRHGHAWHRRGAAGLAVVIFSTAQIANAQDYPDKPILIVAGMAAGGGADVNARRLAQVLNKLLKQNVIVDNVAGAAGNLAAQTVSGSSPDGYTLLFASHPIIAINPLLYEKLPFNPDNLVPVALVSQTPHILLITPGLQVGKLAELVSYAKARPGALNYGSGGAGTSIHLAAELLQNTAGISITHIPYRGAAPAFTALVGNEIQLLFDSSTTAIGHLRGGRVRGLAIASLARLPVVPDLPTFGEGGVAGFEAGVGHGMLVRGATPAARVAALNLAINNALTDPDYRKQMAELGVMLVGGTPEYFRAYLASERRKWGELIQKRGIKVD
jgi:tripartite-type tricarboxylate transporter receptor subunit TctC